MSIFRHRLQYPDGGEGGDGGGTGGGDGGEGAAAAGADGGSGDGGDAGNKGPIWPEQWRKEMAGGDEAFEKQLERYDGPVSAGKALNAAQARIKEGFKPEPFPADGTDEQKTAWREANKLPAEPKGYIENLADGIVLGEDDMPLLESLAAEFHGENLPQSATDIAAKWYLNWLEQADTARAEQDEADKAAIDDALALELGPSEYRNSRNLVMETLEATLPKDSMTELANARTESGKALFSDVGVMKGFIALTRMVNPGGAASIHFGNDPGKGLDDRLEELAKIRQKPGGYDEWMKNDKLRAEERELLDIKQKQKERAA